MVNAGRKVDNLFTGFKLTCGKQNLSLTTKIVDKIANKIINKTQLKYKNVTTKE